MEMIECQMAVTSNTLGDDLGFSHILSGVTLNFFQCKIRPTMRPVSKLLLRNLLTCQLLLIQALWRTCLNLGHCIS